MNKFQPYFGVFISMTLTFYTSCSNTQDESSITDFRVIGGVFIYNYERSTPTFDIAYVIKIVNDEETNINRITIKTATSGAGRYKLGLKEQDATNKHSINA